jgi:hypothetical protein
MILAWFIGFEMGLLACVVAVAYDERQKRRGR